MPFIGNQPALSYTSFAKQDFSTSATTSYTLDNPVANSHELALFINFVRQEPTTAYSASGTTLTLTSATSSSDDMYAIFLGKAIQTVNPPNASVGLSQLTASGTKDSTTFLRGDNTFNAPPNTGITMADQWRWTANFTGNAQPITANWERNDTSFDKIGTGMTESSGIFTFPQTGIYKINTGAFYYLNSNSRYNEIVIELSTNGGSSWTSIAYGYTSISNNTSSTTYASASTEAIVDVTNASNFKLVISVSHHDTNTTVAGNSGRNDNFTTFVRLGDT